MTSRKTLSTIDADTLLSTTLPPTRFIIDRLLPQGLHILAGAPKVGKSWLALWLCLQVAQGTSVWDFPTHRGTVLYLCLEDSLTRIFRSPTTRRRHCASPPSPQASARDWRSSSPTFLRSTPTPRWWSSTHYSASAPAATAAIPTPTTTVTSLY